MKEITMKTHNNRINPHVKVSFKKEHNALTTKQNTTIQNENKEKNNKIIYALGGLALLGITYAIYHKRNKKVSIPSPNTDLPITKGFAKNKKFFNTAGEEVSGIRLVNGTVVNSKNEPFNGYFKQRISDDKTLTVKYINGKLSKSLINDNLFREYAYENLGTEKIIKVTDYSNLGTISRKKTISHHSNGKIKTITINKFNRNTVSTSNAVPPTVSTDYKIFNDKGELLEEISLEKASSSFSYKLYNPTDKTKEELRCVTLNKRGPIKLIYKKNPTHKVAFSHLMEQSFYKKMNEEDASRTIDLLQNIKGYINEKYKALDKELLDEIVLEIKQKFNIK